MCSCGEKKSEDNSTAFIQRLGKGKKNDETKPFKEPSFVQKSKKFGAADEFNSCLYDSTVKVHANGSVEATPELGDMFECEEGVTMQKTDSGSDISEVLSSREAICDWLKSISYCRNRHSCLSQDHRHLCYITV